MRHNDATGPGRRFGEEFRCGKRCGLKSGGDQAAGRCAKRLLVGYEVRTILFCWSGHGGLTRKTGAYQVEDGSSYRCSRRITHMDAKLYAARQSAGMTNFLLGVT
jgi:hypothetical protein